MEKLKKEGKYNKIQSVIEKLKASQTNIPQDMAYLSGRLFDDYIFDMRIIQNYAVFSGADTLEQTLPQPRSPRP